MKLFLFLFVVILTTALSLQGCVTTEQEDIITCDGISDIGYQAISQVNVVIWNDRSGLFHATNEDCQINPTGRDVDIDVR